MMACRWKVLRNALIWIFVVSGVGVARITAATDAQCREILQQALGDKNPDTRKHAVVALSLVGSQFFVPLKGMLQDKEVDVRVATVASLAEVKSKQAVAALRDALNDEVPEVSFAAAKALWVLRDAAGQQALLAVLEGESKTASGFFSKKKRDALRMVHTPGTVFLLALQRSIGFVPVPYLGLGIASMQELLSDPGVSGRATAALMLANEKDAATLEALRDALNDKEWSVRAAAVHALALRSDIRTKNDLAPLLDDDNQAVRLRAAAGYLRVTAREGRSRDTVKLDEGRRVPIVALER